MKFNNRNYALLGIPDLPLNAFKHIGDYKIKPQGGVSSVLDSVGGIISDVVGGVSDALAGVDDAVNENIPGGWGTVGILAGGAGLLSDVAAGEAAANTSAFGDFSFPEGLFGGGGTSLGDIAASGGGYSLGDFGALTPASYGGILGGGSTALTGGIAPEVIGGITASDIGSLAGGAPTAASYGGVLGGGSTELTGGVAPEIGDITASNIGIVPSGVSGGTVGGGLLSGIGSNLGGIASGVGSALSGLGSAGLLGAGNVASGVLSANAAKEAAQIQADAALKAAQMQQDMFNTVNAQGVPYRASGYNALNQIGAMLPGQYTQYDASGKPIGTATGTGYLTQQFGPEQFAAGMDPGYAFRLQQGQMANQRASNLAGGLISGNALQGLQDYTQGMASQEYGNAFNRFQTQRGNIYNTLAGIAGIGQTAQGQANQLAQNNATAQGQLGVGSAAAQAAGKVGQAAGYGGALTGAGNAYLLSQLLNQNQGAAGSNVSGSNFMNAYNAIG